MIVEEREVMIKSLKQDKENMNDSLISITARFNQNKKALASKIVEVGLLLKQVEGKDLEVL